LDLRNFSAAVRRFVGEQRHFHVDGGFGGLERDLQPQAVEQVPKLSLRQLRQSIDERQLVEGRREIGRGGRGIGRFLDQGGRPPTPVIHGLLQLGDPGGDPPPERGRRVLGLEVRHLSLNAALQVCHLCRDLLDAFGGGSGRLLEVGVGETAAPVRLFLLRLPAPFGVQVVRRPPPGGARPRDGLPSAHLRRIA
jgi:hypothetical protein